MNKPSFNLLPWRNKMTIQRKKNSSVFLLLVLIAMGILYLYYYATSVPSVNKLPKNSVDKTKKRPIKKKNQLISLNYQDIQVRAVLQLLADFSGVNIVVSDSVTGNMTLQLHQLPWEQALDVILTMQNLDKRKIGNVLLIEKIPVIQAPARKYNDSHSKPKRKPLHFELMQVNSANANDIAVMLKDKTNSMLSARGILSVDARSNTIWVQDTAIRVQKIKALVKQLDTPTKQVIIQARLVNMTKNCENDIGIRFGLAKSTQLNGTMDPTSQIVTGRPALDHLNIDLGALPLDASPVSIGFALAKLNNNVLLDLELSALESEGRAEIIASPRLMTTNQHSAVIESGEDIPYQESNLNGATSVAFKKAVLSLKVTPQITPDGKLLMDLLINQDSDSGRRVQGVPIIFTKSLETNVLVNNAQTIVLGGIYKQDKNNMVTRVPFLGNLPIVGYLFSRKQLRTRNEELLIFITPRIITNNENKIKVETLH